MREDQLEFGDHHSGVVMEAERRAAGQKPRRVETREPILETPKMQEAQDQPGLSLAGEKG